MLTPEQERMLAEIEAREQAATKGPWKLSPEEIESFDDGETYEVITPAQIDAILTVEMPNGFYYPSQADSDFIAHARTDIPALIALVRTLAKRRAVVCKACGGARTTTSIGIGGRLYTTDCPDCTTGATWEDGE